MILNLRLKGGPGSGHRGHAGRPGQRGGSVTGTGVPKATITPDVLRAAKFTRLEDYEYRPGAQVSYIVDVNDGMGKAIIKPMMEDESLSHIFQQDSVAAEEAAYKTALALGFEETVPVTVRTTHEGRKVSAQVWVEDAQTVYDAVRDPSIDALDLIDVESYKRSVILDTVIGKTDRHTRNLLFRSDGKIVNIDNGASFSVSGDFDYPELEPYHLTITWQASDIAPVLSLLDNTSYRNYVESTFSADAWSALEVRSRTLIAAVTELGQ